MEFDLNFIKNYIEYSVTLLDEEHTFYNFDNLAKDAFIFFEIGKFLTDLELFSNFIRSNTECISIPIEDFKDFLFQFKIKKHLEGF